ncbi:MAG: LysR substrate-binding domain-containing protein [Luteolibacter sp.]
MELRQLEYAVSILLEGSITQAAQKCHVSQPSLSQQLKLLEEELGEPLVKRKPRGVEATAAGKIFLEHALPILAAMEALKSRFSQRQEIHEGRLVFGVIPTIAPYLLPKILAPFREAFPRMDLQVREGKTSALIQQVVDGSIEFAILSDVTPQDLKKWSLHMKELFHEPLLLATSQEHPLALAKQPPRPEDLQAETLIHLSDGHCLTDRTLKICRLGRLDPKLECDQLETALAMVGAGMGIAVVPELAVASRRLPLVNLRRFQDPMPERTICLLKKRGIPLSKPAEELVELI